jgi:NAD(P)-dependent dehydrogenase (short-subunit alcohol dehydrogenase family)
MSDMHGKTVLITGANQGIGKASAIALGKMGAKLVLVCRNPDKAREAVADIKAQAGTQDVELIVADLSIQSEVRRAAAEFLKTHDRLDVLLNNAGVLVTSRRETKDGIEETFAINHLAYFLLTNLLLDVLKKSAPSRIVSVSSTIHARGKMQWDDLQFKKGYSAFPAYNQSKLCNILFTRELSRRLEGTGVTANSLHPGVIGSGFGQTYGGLMALAVKIAKPFMTSPEKGAATSVYLASSPEVAGVTGKYFDKCAEAKSSRASRDDDAAKRLWAISEEMTGLRGVRNGAAA